MGYPLAITKVPFLPVCATCVFAAAQRQTKQTGELGPTNPEPGDFVSVDTNVASTPGFIPTKQGKPTKQRYNSSTLWVDKASKFLWIDHQDKNDCRAALLKSKISFENYARQYDREIKHIHSDNGIFATKSFVNACELKGQKHTLCAVGAHHQNGIAERYIGITTTKARTILIHAMQKWSKQITAEL